MSFIKNIFLFLKNKLNKEKNVKMIKEPTIDLSKEEKNNVIFSLKKYVNEKKKQKVETIKCPGDGLGIQNKINY